MIAQNSEELIRLASTYADWPTGTANEITEKYDVVKIGYPTRGDWYITTTGRQVLVEYSFSGSPVLIVKRKKTAIDMNREYSFKVKISDIYDNPVLPENYEFVDFRAPKLNELFLSIGGVNRDRVDCCCISTYTSPRIIVRKVS